MGIVIRFGWPGALGEVDAVEIQKRAAIEVNQGDCLVVLGQRLVESDSGIRFAAIGIQQLVQRQISTPTRPQCLSNFHVFNRVNPAVVLPDRLRVLQFDSPPGVRDQVNLLQLHFFQLLLCSNEPQLLVADTRPSATRPESIRLKIESHRKLLKCAAK